MSDPKKISESISEAVNGYEHLKNEPEKIIKMDPNTKEYWDGIYDIKPITLTDEKRKQLIKTKLNTIANQVSKKFSPSTEQVELMRRLYAYFSGESDALNQNKGLILIGKTGVGKTSILTSFLSVPFGEFIEGDWYNEKPKMTSCIEVVDWFDSCNSGKNYTDWKERYKGDWYFSDLGSEPKHRYATSDSEPVIGKLLEYRANRPTGKTYFCTNLSTSELVEKYGQRVVSRIFGSCNVVDLNNLGITKDYRI